MFEAEVVTKPVRGSQAVVAVAADQRVGAKAAHQSVVAGAAVE